MKSKKWTDAYSEENAVRMQRSILMAIGDMNEEEIEENIQQFRKKYYPNSMIKRKNDLEREMAKIYEDAKINGVTLIIEESEMKKIAEHVNKGDTLILSVRFSEIYFKNDEYGLYDSVKIRINNKWLEEMEARKRKERLEIKE